MHPKIELPLEIEAYNNQWPTLFTEEKALLIKTSEIEFKQIEHIGSTSIPGSKAKPIIDILVVVDDFNNINTIKNCLENNDYHLKNTHQENKYYYYIKKDSNDNFYSITLMQASNHKDIERLLKFKEFLIDHPTAIIKYDFLKSVLQIEYPDDQDKYAKAKDEFVNDIKEQFE